MKRTTKLRLYKRNAQSLIPRQRIGYDVMLIIIKYKTITYYGKLGIRICATLKIYLSQVLFMVAVYGHCNDNIIVGTVAPSA
jgi:hypothetical protein